MSPEQPDPSSSADSPAETASLVDTEAAPMAAAPAPVPTEGPARKRRRGRVVAVIVIGFHELGFLSLILAVIATRTAQGAIAWGLGLNTFPYIAVPMYWVLGRRNVEGYVEAWKGRHEGVRQFEINAIIVDEGFGQQVEAMLVNDMAHSVEWDPSDLAQAPFLTRVAASAARLTAPVL